MTNFGKSIVGIIIILILLGGGYYFTRTGDSSQGEMSSNTATTTNSETSTTNHTTEQSSGKKIPFVQFLAQGGAHTCTVTQNLPNGGSSSGTLYVSGDMMSGEFTSTMDGKTMTTNIIARDGYTYMWTSMMPTMGFKMKKVSGTASTSAPAGTNHPAGWNAEQIGDYNCSSWTIDQSKFELPTTVKFTLMGTN